MGLILEAWSLGCDAGGRECAVVVVNQYAAWPSEKASGISPVTPRYFSHDNT